MESSLLRLNSLIHDKGDIRSFIYSQIHAGDSIHRTKTLRKKDHIETRKQGNKIAEFIARIKKQKDDIDLEASYISWLKYNVNYGLLKRIEPNLVMASDKIKSGEWLKVPYLDYMSDIDNAGFLFSKYEQINGLHFVHESTEDPALIAYYPSVDHLRQNRIIKTKLGKYLNKYKDHLGLNDSIIKSMVEKHNARIEARTGWQVKFIESNDPDGWLKVYADCEYKSCMVTEEKAKPYIRSYAHKNSFLRLAYLQSGDTIKARCIVREDDPDYLQWIRIYPPADQSAEGTYLKQYLESNGYKHGNLMGILLKTWWHDDGCWASPYVDWGNGDEPFGDYKSIDGEHYIIVNDDGELSLNHTDGTTWRDDDDDDDDYSDCVCCGDNFHYNDMTDDLCDHCDRNYTWAHSRNGEYNYVANDNVIEVGDDSYDIDYLSDYDIYECEHDGEFYHIDDLVNTSMGYIYHGYSIALDHADNDGNDYAHEEDARELPDGTHCHKDNFEELNEEIQKGLEHEQAIT